MVAHAISHMTMGSVSNVVKSIKDLVKDVHRLARLGVRLEDSSNGDFITHHNSESYFMVKVKSKQHLDQSLMDLEKSVLVSFLRHSPWRGWCL